MLRRVLALGAWLVVTLAAPPVDAAWFGGRYHDGLLFQVQGGVGYLRSAATYPTSDVDIRGAAAELAVVLGGSLTPTFALGGACWLDSAPSPQFRGLGSNGPGGSTTLTLAACGVGVTTWFGRSDFYASVVPSVTRLNLEIDRQRASTRLGFGVRLSLGKEWRVASRWGVGVAGTFDAASNRDQGDGPTWTSTAFGIAFSASFN